MYALQNCENIIDKWRRNTEVEREGSLKNSTYRVDAALEEEVDRLVTESDCPADTRSELIRLLLRQWVSSLNTAEDARGEYNGKGDPRWLTSK